MVTGIVLAAGSGTRMKSNLPKVLHQVCGRPMIHYILDAVINSGVDNVVVVLGSGAELVSDYINKNFKDGIKTVFQPEQDGTAGAVKVALSNIKDVDEVLVCCGDTPLITADTLREFINTSKNKRPVCSLITMELEDPTGYGRIIRDKEGYVVKIVEETDLENEERMIREVNSGVWFFDVRLILEFFRIMKKNERKGEYYLTDVVEFCVKKGVKVNGFQASDPVEFYGVNDRMDLYFANYAMRLSIIERIIESGVTIIDPYNTYIDSGVVIERDCFIEPGVVIKGNTHIDQETYIGPNIFINSSTIGKRCRIYPFSHIDGAVVEDDVTVGPFARLRYGTTLRRGSKIGNFVEVKKAVVGSGSKANHLSYIGDTVLGEGVNIGAGTITCNYDGFEKHQTVIEDGTFIGSNSCLVAPVKIGKDALVAAGSTITKDVPDNALAFGRARQVNREGLGMSYRRKKNKKE